jgi:hypothetical protein
LDNLEGQNEEDISGLSAKVKILKNVMAKWAWLVKREIYNNNQKQITGKIGDEIRSGNSLIDTMVGLLCNSSKHCISILNI